jgi:hypothetical protein
MHVALENRRAHSRSRDGTRDGSVRRTIDRAGRKRVAESQ